MIDQSWSAVVATVFLGAVGLWLAHNYRRQVRVKLAERQVDAYQRLWKLTGVATPERRTPLDSTERRKLYTDMIQWYFDDGEGIYLSAATRDLFIGVRSNLICPRHVMRPPALARELATIRADDAERRRGCVSIRQTSLLRTQLKADLNLHFDFNYYSDLRTDDRAFLRSCGLSVWRKPWRRRPFRSPGRNGPNPCVCGMCPGRKNGQWSAPL